MAKRIDPNSSYWEEYSPLQHTKHALIQRYLGGWFAKLGSWADRVIYVDTHAGRGRHATGQVGSPIIALTTLLDHSHRARLLRSSEFIFHFIDAHEENVQALEAEIAALSPLPLGVKAGPPRCGDAFALVRDLLPELRESTPAFVFVDPFGFRVPGQVLREVMKAGRVELFINLMWRELDMALRQGARREGLAELADEVFDGPEWRDAINGDSSNERAEQAVDLLARKVGAKWATSVRMLGDNGATRYILLHLSNHDEGRDLMKECVWNVCGGFVARKSDNPAQQLLITPEPDWSSVKTWILEQLIAGPLRLAALHERARPTIWRDVHVNKCFKALLKDGRISTPDERTVAANPLLSISER